MTDKLIKFEQEQTARLGFWLYILSDLMIFAALFATFMVLRHNVAGGPSGQDIFDPPFVLLQTIILLTSSFTIAMAVAAARHARWRDMKLYLISTGVLGATFLGLEIYEFVKLVSEGYTWQISAFLSSYFALVGTHGAHILIGLIWLVALYVLISRRGMNDDRQRKLGLFSLFWHFLDIVWIFIFTIVYMFGIGVS